MNKQWLVLIFAIVVAGGVWLMWPEQPGSAGADAGATTPGDSADAASGGEGTAPAPESAETDTAASSPFAVTDDEAPDDNAPASTAVQDSDTGIDADEVAAPPGDIATQPADTGTAFNDDASRASGDASSAAGGAGEPGGTAEGSEAPSGTGRVIEVPESYPVTEASKYFVPKEERRPGNLGGPPPLDFPGGPSDPNRNPDGTDELGPPPAPGQ